MELVCSIFNQDRQDKIKYIQFSAIITLLYLNTLNWTQFMQVKIKILLKICFIGFNTTDIWFKMLILESKFNSQGKLKYTYLHLLLLTNKTL